MSTLDVGAEVKAALRDMLPLLRELVRNEIEHALNEQLLTVEQGAALANMTQAALRKRIVRGGLTVVRHGRSVRLRREDVLGLTKTEDEI